VTSARPVHRILLDTDLAMGAAGSDIDDGFALALALAEPEMSVELVSTVNGNTDVDTATVLATQLLARLGRPDVPVVRGAGAPLRGRGRPRPPGSPEPPPPPAPSGHAAVAIAERVLAEPGELTVVAIGPLTNVALALLLEPAVATAVREIVIMGGIYLGSTNLAAMAGEFNIWSDPDAAAIVFESGAPLRCVGLDVTLKVRLTPDDADRMESSGGAFGGFAGACTREWIAHWDRQNPGAIDQHGSCALHDPLAVAAVTHPQLLTWRPAHVRVETASPVTRGIAVADLLTTEDPPPANCRIATDVDADGFRELFLTRVSQL
jgi:purine nucleosidase